MTHTTWTELTLTPSDWSTGLHHSFRKLRQSWSSQWIGLPSVLLACQNALNLTTSTNKLEQACNHLSLQIAELAEQHGQENCHIEPAYHNRLHTADVLVALTTLMYFQTQCIKSDATPWVALLLVAAVAHDFAHPGGINHKPFEIESYSWSKVQNSVNQALPEIWSSCVETLILNTDRNVVPDNHHKVANITFNWDLNWACVLLNEADIMASATTEFGIPLSNALSDEWSKLNISSEIATPKGRATFLQSIQFTSQASHALMQRFNLD